MGPSPKGWRAGKTKGLQAADGAKHCSAKCWLQKNGMVLLDVGIPPPLLEEHFFFE